MLFCGTPVASDTVCASHGLDVVNAAPAFNLMFPLPPRRIENYSGRSGPPALLFRVHSGGVLMKLHNGRYASVRARPKVIAFDTLT